MTKILFEQSNPVPGQELATPSPDLFIAHMHRAFGKFPVELGKDEVERLEGMASTWTDIATNPYDIMVRAIKRLGTIRVWAEYPDKETNK
jgi:hypothetical protein